MFRKLFFIATSLYTIVSGDSQHTEYRRQYNSYLRHMKKIEPENGFQNFLTTLNEVETFNRDNTHCRSYLTQHSDTLDKQRILKKCFR